MKSLSPKITVLIPVFNGSSYLEQTVSSVQKSTYKNFEIILVDDGSTDKSKEICHKLERIYKNVRFYGFGKNKGMTRSLNFGIARSKGKYIARINQDDLMVKDRLVKQVKFLEENPDHVAVGGFIKLFSKDNPNFGKVKFPLTDTQIRKAWLILSPYSDPTVMFRKSSYLRTKGYSQNFWPADDVHMWYQLGKVGKLANLSTILTKVRWHEGAGSIKFHRIQMQKTWEVHRWAEKHIGTPNLGTRIFWICQYLAGVIFPPQFNWFVYRLIRKVIERYRGIKTDIRVIAQPIKASLSGVYSAK